ncbi:MAG: glutaminyl-peptide cyclotransferase [Bryobacteraceae bacterium]|jgi:glutaminyl-peptide cyclotransferase
MRFLFLAAALAATACGPAAPADSGSIPEYGYQVVHVYPHDPLAFTEGLFYLNGYLYESTGMEGQSSARKVRLETGEVLQKHEVPEQYFGEGIIAWKDKLVQLTWRTEVGFVYDLNTFETRSQFHYPGEGWSMTEDGKRIIMDDGTPQLRFWDPDTLREIGRLTVTANGEPVANLNELEWVKGEIYANIWMTDRIARIDAKTGKVVGWIDCTGLLSPSDRVEGQTDVLNGIAYDAEHDRLFVTGKRWPKLFEIRLVRKTGQ